MVDKLVVVFDELSFQELNFSPSGEIALRAVVVLLQKLLNLGVHRLEPRAPPAIVPVPDWGEG